jgi:hypothetical protein
MRGQRYYTYARSNVRFFVLDTNFLDPVQLGWIQSALKDAPEAWKIACFEGFAEQRQRVRAASTARRA